MANKWWDNTASNNLWSGNSWGATESTGGGSKPGSGDDAKFSATASQFSCSIGLDEVCDSLSGRSADTGGTDNWGSSFGARFTINEDDSLTVSGYFRLEGQDSTDDVELDMNSNATLTVDSMILGDDVDVDLQTNSNINCAGDCDIENSTFVNNERGVYTQTGNGTYSNSSTNRKFYSFIIDSGVTLTCGVASNFFVGFSGGDFTVNGTIASSTFAWKFFLGDGGTLTLGANSNFTGSGTVDVRLERDITVSDSKSSAYDFTGTLLHDQSQTNMAYVCGRWDNADVQIKGYSADRSFRQKGDLYCVDFTLTNSNSTQITIDNANANSDLYISGDFSLDTASGTVVWTKGTGNLRMTGSSGSQTWDIDGKTVEDIICNCDGATKTIEGGAFTSDSLTMTAGTLQLQNDAITTFTNGFSGTGGTLQSDSSGNQAEVDFTTSTGRMTGVTIKDIAISGGDGDKRIDAKGSTNSGNNDSRIIFRDEIGFF